MTVFLSYHHSKLDVVEHTARFLERHGVRTWYAPRDVGPGGTWDEALSKAIQSSSALVLLFCAQADASQHVKREIAIADKHHIPIYWLRLELIEPDKLGYFLSSKQWIDWLDRRDAVLETLVEDLKSDSSPSSVGASGEAPEQEAPGWDGSWPRNIFVFDNDRLAGEAVARAYIDIARDSPDSSVVLPTGRAATHVFRALIRLVRKLDDSPFEDVHFISDTETFGVYDKHPTSRTRHVREMLIEPLDTLGMAPAPDQIHLLSGLFAEVDPVHAASKVIRLWPPSAHAVSVAPSGEVLAFEVATYTDAEALADSGVRVIELSDHGKGYIDPNQPSRSVLSIGLGTALMSQVLLVLAFGGPKSSILRRMTTGGETPGLPATMLRRHTNAHIITTQALADEAGLLDHSRRMTPEEAVEHMVGPR